MLSSCGSWTRERCCPAVEVGQHATALSLVLLRSAVLNVKPWRRTVNILSLAFPCGVCVSLLWTKTPAHKWFE